jgi:hypothetical protein
LTSNFSGFSLIQNRKSKIQNQIDTPFADEYNNSNYCSSVSLECRFEIWSVSAKDVFHEAVKQALQKEQWVITSQART